MLIIISVLISNLHEKLFDAYYYSVTHVHCVFNIYKAMDRLLIIDPIAYTTFIKKKKGKIKNIV